MLLTIRHSLHYRYSRGVFCEPLTIRLRPREHFGQRLHSWSLKISPSPAGTSEFVDLEGNVCQRVWFEGLTDELRIEALSRVETVCHDPFQFLLTPEAVALPVRFENVEQTLSAYYAKPSTLASSVRELSDSLQAQAGRQTVRFLSALAAHVAREFEIISRPEGDPWAAEETLRLGQGAARDLAVLSCELARAAGLPARFVNGYAASPDADGRHHLRSWAEVYLPGAGWRGFDPVSGLAVDEGFVAMAAARAPAQAACTSGAYRGAGAESELTATIEVVEDSPFPSEAPFVLAPDPVARRSGELDVAGRPSVADLLFEPHPAAEILRFEPEPAGAA